MFKKIFYSVIFLVATVTSFSQEGTKVISGLVPNSPLDTYPVTYDYYGYGGMRVAANVTERNAISDARRRNGMMVYTVADSTLWLLDSVHVAAPYWKKVIEGTAIECPPNFALIQGNALENQSIIDALTAKQDVIPKQNLLEYRMMYYDGQQRVRSFVDDVRGALLVRVDSTEHDFQAFSDTSNLLLSKGLIPNTDSTFQVSGLYWYNNATRGWKPSVGSGMLLVMVQQDNKYTTGAGRVEQVFFDYNLNRIATRNANSGVWATPDTTASYSDLRSSGASYLPITGGALTGNNAFIGLSQRIPAIVFPTNNNIQIGNTNGHRFYMADSTGMVNFGVGRTMMFDFSLVDPGATRNVKFPNITGGEMTVLGNVTNAANGLLKLDGSAHVPAASVTAVGLATTGSAVAGNVLRGDMSWQAAGNVIGTTFVGRISTGAGTVSASTSTYAILSGNEATGLLAIKGTGMGTAGTFSNAWIFTTSTQDASGALTATLFKNGSATSIVITVPAGAVAGSFSDVTHTATIVAGDKIEWQLANAATATSATLLNTSIDFKQ